MLARVVPVGVAVVVAGSVGAWYRDVHGIVEQDAGRIALTVIRLLDPDREGNLWSWYSVTLLLALAVALGVGALQRTGRRRRAYLVLTGVAVFLSADEGAQLHETLSLVGNFVLGSGGPTFAWVLPGALLAAAVAVGLVVVARDVEPRLRLRLVLAGLVFLTGALGVESVGGSFAEGLVMGQDVPPSPYYVLVALEETLELLGASLALWAALHAVVDPRPVAPAVAPGSTSGPASAPTDPARPADAGTAVAGR
ncbi:hypothetical protein Cma02nite_00830 [Cellulomonas marina]|uniref:Uncharacterized protein n=1 Tax=Cellulomonas marina TaxID=988821 RepID=A0A1I0VXW4_9CELL|nr:hypothetical protein Cma02nite_00830 [Cellulomonas marina]SFA81058.1 hypothetical protein SAMN05421867_10231 [Cellulomonas marina]